MSATPCFHCGLPVPAGAHYTVCIDAVPQPMCCPGCAAVAETIVAAGLGDFYRTRTGYSGNAAESCPLPEALALYDEAASADGVGAGGASGGASEGASGTPAARSAAATAAGPLVESVFSIEGLRCAACMWLIERHLARLPGVAGVELNVARERVAVRHAAGAVKPSAVIQALGHIGYPAYPYDAARQGGQLEQAQKTLLRELFVAGLAMMQVMNYVVAFYLDRHDAMDAGMADLMRWASLVLTLPAVFYSARPFFRGAWRDLVNRMPGMDVPVALGIAAAFVASVVATVRGGGAVYFDSVTMFIFLLLASRYLELGARRKAAAALGRLQHAVPDAAHLLPGWPARHDTTLVSAQRLQAGDFILVKPGETCAADGEIVAGASEADLSLLTGESRPLARGVGDSLPGGAVNVSQPLVLRVTRASRDSTLALLVRLVESAGAGKPQLALWADRVAAWFVAALLVFAVGVFAAWQWFDAARAWPIAIAVLVVSCPCALSLATPTALAAATDRLLRQGVLIVQPHVLETLRRASHVVFDKTGTLTMGRPVLRRVVPLGSVDAGSCLALAAALEAGSAHPLARALLAAAGDVATAAPEGAVEAVPGQGLRGRYQGEEVRIGGAGFVAALSGPFDALLAQAEAAAPGASLVWLGGPRGLLARFELADALRPEALAVVRSFQAEGKQVLLLSGDRQAVAASVAAELGIARAVGDVLPEGKLAFVRALQAEGAVVAMVGDGSNDAAVLAAADVSFAMGGGAALAQLHADCVILSGQLGALAAAARGARQTLAVIRQNLAWASLYNLIAIPAAALGWLDPWLSALGMSLSSAVVVLNALRLRRLPRAERVAHAASLPAAPARGTAAVPALAHVHAPTPVAAPAPVAGA